MSLEPRAVNFPATSGSPQGTTTHGRQSLRRRLLSGGLWVVGARVCGLGSAVVANAILARQLLPREFGDYVLLCSITNAGSLLAIFGMSTGIVRFVAEELAHDRRPSALQVLQWCRQLARCTTAVVMLAVFVGLLFAGPHFLDSQTLILTSVLTALALAMQAEGNLNSATLRAMGEMRYSSILGGQGGVAGPLANMIFLLFLSAAAGYQGLTLDLTLMLSVVAFGIALLIGHVWVRRTLPEVMVTSDGDRSSAQAVSTDEMPYGIHDQRAILIACFPMLLVQVLSTVSRQGGLWVAGMTVAPQELGLYAAATRTINLVAMPLSLVNLSVMAFIPQLRAQQRLSELERILRVSVGWAAIPSFLALVTFVAAPSTFLRLFLGRPYESAGALLSLLSIGHFLYVWCGLSELTLVLSGHARAAACINGVSAVMILVGGPVIAHFFGSSGLAAFASLLIGIQSISQWLLTRRLVGIWTHATLFPAQNEK